MQEGLAKEVRGKDEEQVNADPALPRTGDREKIKAAGYDLRVDVVQDNAECRNPPQRLEGGHPGAGHAGRDWTGRDLPRGEKRALCGPHSVPGGIGRVQAVVAHGVATGRALKALGDAQHGPMA